MLHGHTPAFGTIPAGIVWQHYSAAAAAAAAASLARHAIRLAVLPSKSSTSSGTACTHILDLVRRIHGSKKQSKAVEAKLWKHLKAISVCSHRSVK